MNVEKDDKLKWWNWSGTTPQKFVPAHIYKYVSQEDKQQPCLFLQKNKFLKNAQSLATGLP